MEMELDEDQDGRRERSPRYPALDLPTALERARVLLGKEGKHFAPFEAVVEHWGYSAKSSAGRLAVAALRKFGLVEVKPSESGRTFRASPLAMRILLDERPNSIERAEAVREAALLPPIHSELWRKYEGAMPSDATLKYYLRVGRGFTESAAADLLREFRRTLEFAEMLGGDPSPDVEAVSSGGITASAPPEAPPHATAHAAAVGGVVSSPGNQARRAVHLPLSPDAWATLEAPFPLSEEAWHLMMAVLEAMKPGLTEGPRASVGEADADGGRERSAQSPIGSSEPSIFRREGEP